jgi:hypothetical protein
LETGKTTAFTFDLAPPDGGWLKDTRLRAQTSSPLGSSHLTAKWNGGALTPSPDASEPYPNPDPAMLGTPETLIAWALPHNLLRAGPNELAVTLESGDAVELAYLDFAG